MDPKIYGVYLAFLNKKTIVDAKEAAGKMQLYKDIFTDVGMNNGQHQDVEWFESIIKFIKKYKIKE